MNVCERACELVFTRRAIPTGQGSPTHRQQSLNPNASFGNYRVHGFYSLPSVCPTWTPTKAGAHRQREAAPNTSWTSRGTRISAWARAKEPGSWGACGTLFLGDSAVPTRAWVHEQCPDGVVTRAAAAANTVQIGP